MMESIRIKLIITDFDSLTQGCLISPSQGKNLTPKGSHISARGQRSATPGYESELFSFPERDTYRWLPQIRYNQE
ncbi:MAG: hypothetical protein B6245_15600 [Desulfobacteraceae bacterium 4572_88]|nr:MAG: hypothetical protein B6245_15600 [Desulfobacteraceae bacterium 4572_88]